MHSCPAYQSGRALNSWPKISFQSLIQWERILRKIRESNLINHRWASKSIGSMEGRFSKTRENHSGEHSPRAPLCTTVRGSKGTPHWISYLRHHWVTRLKHCKTSCFWRLRTVPAYLKMLHPWYILSSYDNQEGKGLNQPRSFRNLSYNTEPQTGLFLVLGIFQINEANIH